MEGNKGTTTPLGDPQRLNFVIGRTNLQHSTVYLTLNSFRTFDETRYSYKLNVDCVTVTIHVRYKFFAIDSQ